jgi:DnaJ-class molecular chaperone
VLSDPDERWEYDARDRNVFFRMFGCGSSGTGCIYADADDIFADVFAEVTNLLPSSLREPNISFHSQFLRPEVERHMPRRSFMGILCGQVFYISFILGT